LFALAKYFQQTRRHPLAMEVINRIASLVQAPEPKAVCYLSMGQLAEGMGDFEAAVDYYSQAFRLEPDRTEIWYFINNNLGYALNQLGRNAEAEGYCRAAIKIDPKRYNAFKNLGVSQEGQGALAEAAASYIQAVRKEAVDSRALNHLERLLARHPQLLRQNPALVTELENCRDAVSFARNLISKIPENYNDQ
jgi:tetratricopeptide (TPR) repeat protein